MLTAGYMTYDFCVQKFFVGGDDALAKQTLFHHIIGVFGIFLALFTGYGYCGTSSVIFLCEISTFFMNYRSMYSKEELGLPVPMFNQVLFFITFTAFRMVLFPYLTYLIVVSLTTAWSYLDTPRKISGVISAMIFMAICILQIIWYRLIIKGVIKLLKGSKLSDKYETSH
jgi:hypothetical protein